MPDAFLAALGQERATFQVFPDRDGAPYPRIMHGPHRVLAQRLGALNRQGCGVFVMVNAGDLRGRRAENVVRVTGYFADLDGAELCDGYPLAPTVINESSPRRYHCYWRVTEAPLESFGYVQKHVALLLGSDDKVHDLPRVMRVPGYLHQKGEPFKTRTLELNPEAVYTHGAFLEAFAVPEYVPPPKVAPLPQACQDYIRVVTGGQGPNRHVLLDRVATAASGSRNDTLFRMASALANDVMTGALDELVMREELAAAGQLAGLGQMEVERTVSSALRYARGN